MRPDGLQVFRGGEAAEFIVRTELKCSWAQCGLGKPRVQRSQGCVLRSPAWRAQSGENWKIPHLLKAFDTFIQNLGPTVTPSKRKRGLFEVMRCKPAL